MAEEIIEGPRLRQEDYIFGFINYPKHPLIHRFILTFIEIEKEKIKNLMKDNGRGITVEASLIPLSKWFGSMIRAREITVVEYQNITEEYARSNKAA